MREAMRADAQLTDAGWPTNPLEARYEGGTAAETTISSDTLILYTYDFTDLPSPIDITGMTVHIDAKKTDSGGTSSIRIGAELSWNSGSSWTSIKTTPLLSTSTGTYVLGDPADLWGHAWARGELANSGTFRLRLTASFDTVSGSPTWHVYWARPTAYYERTSSLTIYPVEPIAITEQTYTSPRVIRTYEKLDVFDSGSSRQGTTVLGRQQQQLKITGTAVSSLQTSAGFTATITRPRHREGIGCRLRSEAIGLDIFIGDSVLTTTGTSLSYPGNLMQAGFLDLGEVTSEGNFMGEQQATTCEIRLMNRYYVNQKAGADATARKLSELVNNKAIVGGSLTVWAFSDSGDGWVQGVIFDGVIEEIDFEKAFFTVRGVVAGTGAIPVPDIFVDETLFSYEPGSTATDTGEQVKGNKGRPVPIGLGRFDYGAVKLPTSFAAGHPFRVTFDPLSEDDRKNYTSIALFPSMLGLKHPMMPTVHVASKYRRVEADASAPEKFTSFPYQNVFLYGSRKSTPALGVATAPIGNIYRFDSQRFPGSDTITSTGTFNQMDYCLLWTWHQDEVRSVGMPVVLTRTHQFRQDLSNVPVPSFCQRHVGANFMEKLGYPNQLTSPAWTDGTARHAFGVFANNLTPPLSTFQGIERWPGVLQAIAIPMDGPTKRQMPTKLSLEDNIWSPTFATYEGTGQGHVENLRNCMDADFENYTRIQNTGYMSLQCPLTGPSLGKIRGVRVCILWNNSTSTAQNVYLYARFGPSVNYAFQRSSANALNADFNRDFGALHNEADIIDTRSGAAVPVYKLFNVAATPFASVWMLPDFDAAAGHPFVLFDDSSFEANPPVDPKKRYPPRKGRREWQFTSMDLAASDSFTYLEWPWDFMIDVRDLSGGSPIASRWFDLVAIWMEVVYESPLNGTAPAGLTVDFDGGWERFYHGFAGPYNDRSYQWRLQAPIHITYEGEARRSAPSPIYVTGKGAVDDASGSITGTAYELIENPADIALALIRHYGGNRTFANAAQGTSFGSFATARTQLAASGYRMTIVVDEAETLGAVLRRIGAQSRSLIQEQTDDLGETIWRMFVDVKPADIPTGRNYRNSSGDPFFFSADEMAEGTFKAELTRYEEIASQVSVQFGLHRPTRGYSDEKYVTPTASNFASGATTYKNAMAEAQRQYGSTRRITITAPDIWDPLVAERLCKWHADRVRRKRVSVEFETFANAMDLKPGHIIGIQEQLVASDPDLGVPYPGDSATWTVVRFSVTQVSMRKDAGQMARIFVRAEEVATEAT